MTSRIATVTLLVRDYDEAIAWFTRALGFHLLQDKPLSSRQRWVLVAPPGDGGARILLARAADDTQRAAVGNQAGGRVVFFLETDDFDRDHQRMVAAGVKFLETPRREVYGTVAVFEDLYGNPWDLIQPNHA